MPIQVKLMFDHAFPFDPTYGHTRSDLRQCRLDDPLPGDFATFWRNLRSEAQEVPLRLSVSELPSPAPAYRLLRLTYSSFPDFRVGAWAILPRDVSGIRFGRVVGHGYGGREEPEWAHAHPGRAVLFPVAPGFHISADPRVPLNDSGAHVVFGITSRETYILGPCAAALWRGPEILSALLPSVRMRFHYVGWSFGGGLGTLMLPWEPGYETAEIGQPTFGNHPFRLRHECSGSGDSVRRLWLKNPSIFGTLRYFDAAFAARLLKIPTVYACSQFDPAVPPPGQFSVFNAHAGPKRLSPFSTGHFEDPGPEIEKENHVHETNLRELIGPAATG